MKTMLQHLREALDVGQRELAARAQVSQETISQLESGKSSRPRLDTLTKLRDALQLGDLKPEELLEPSPLFGDPELVPAAALMIRLLKALPVYRGENSRAGEFWRELSRSLGYTDLYPATKIRGHLRAAAEDDYPNAATDLAEYVLTFFDPDIDAVIGVLVKHSGIGPGRYGARRWCRDVTDAAWVLHRAAMTSYPTQVGEFLHEAQQTTDPARVLELCASVYPGVRARAYARAPFEVQVAALSDDPSAEVHYAIAKAADGRLQREVLSSPTAWSGLAINPRLDSRVAEQLVDAVLGALTGPYESEAGRALFSLAENVELPEPLLRRISAAIDHDDRDEDASGGNISAVLAIRRTLHTLDAAKSANADESGASGEQASEVADRKADSESWWRRAFGGK
ncbi:helix-turn-helix domain-containing protein [Actinokineospora cianjurensis]|uniref:Helix-turn-helix protein n=1 Tax=Actinokineospora cianjurensis TaxID=585224 RepID=A0A421AVK2_9PSEU|nr:helix-turn-helix transcriptional regulator [Actinokineospora cianjurensis]RLK54109.1 helix-turn-helix protein [Actinokineospora cianjurensis]